MLLWKKKTKNNNNNKGKVWGQSCSCFNYRSTHDTFYPLINKYNVITIYYKSLFIILQLRGLKACMTVKSFCNTGKSLGHLGGHSGRPGIGHAVLID